MSTESLSRMGLWNGTITVRQTHSQSIWLQRPKLILVFANTGRPEVGGFDNIRISLAVWNQVVDRLIHISDHTDRVKGADTWKMLKNSLTLEHKVFK